MPNAIIVGGGVGGLVMARQLALGGLSVTVLEAQDRCGGKVASHTVGGIELDSGAESFANRGGTVAALAAELGVIVEPPSAGGAWLKPARGNPLPLPRTSFLGIPGNPLAGDVIRVIGHAGAARAYLDSLLPGDIGLRERTLGGLVRRRMGSVVLEKLVAPIVSGIHSSHPDDLDVDRVAPDLRSALLTHGSLARAVRSLREASPAGSAVSGVVGGMHHLVERLVADCERRGVVLRVGVTVTGADAGGVLTATGRLAADHVVLATPLDPSTENSIVLATLVVRVEALDSRPRGTGLLVAPGAVGIEAKALTHSTSKWAWLAARVPPHLHVVRLSYGGPIRTGLEERARQDAELLLGVSIPASVVLGFDTVAWAAVPQWTNTIPGVLVVGESAAGTGLAAVISHARQQAARLLGSIES